MDIKSHTDRGYIASTFFSFLKKYGTLVLQSTKIKGDLGVGKCGSWSADARGARSLKNRFVHALWYRIVPGTMKTEEVSERVPRAQ